MSYLLRTPRSPCPRRPREYALAVVLCQRANVACALPPARRQAMRRGPHHRLVATMQTGEQRELNTWPASPIVSNAATLPRWSTIVRAYARHHTAGLIRRTFKACAQPAMAARPLPWMDRSGASETLARGEKELKSEHNINRRIRSRVPSEVRRRQD